MANYFIFSTLSGVTTARVVTRWGFCPDAEVSNLPLESGEVVTTHPTYSPDLTDDQEIVFNQTTSVLSIRTRTKTTNQLDREGRREIARLLRNSDAIMTTDIQSMTSFRRYAEWTAYRKLLRNLPNVAGWPTSIIWPTPPVTVFPVPPLAPFFRISAADVRSYTGTLTTTRAGAVATRWNRQGLMETVAANKTRVDFDPLTGTAIGFMCEGASTNVCLQSQSIGTAPWTRTRATATSGPKLGPFGVAMQKLMSDATAASTHTLDQTFTVATAGVPAWVKVHVAAAEYPGIQVVLTNTGMTTFTASFNAATGAMSPANSFLSFNKGSGIWEINTYCIPVSTGAGALTVMVRLFDGTSPTFNGDVAKGVYVDCIQVEFAQSYSSFIPTTTAAVTRNADDHDLVFSTDDFNPALFSVYCEARYNGGGAFNSGNRYAFAIDNNTANNLVGFCNDTGKAHGMRIIRTGTTELAVPGNSPSNFDLIPAAARIIAGDIAISNDGVNVVTSAITNVPQFALLAPRLKLGRNSAGNYLNGHVREVMLFSGEALTNAQLIALAA